MSSRTCPKCGAKMLLQSKGVALLTYPAQYPQEWKCGCGHREPGPTLRDETEEDRFVARWRAANSINPLRRLWNWLL